MLNVPSCSTPPLKPASSQHQPEATFHPSLSVVCETHPSFLQTAVDEFIRAPKGSDAAVREGDKIELFLTHKSNPNLPNSPMLSHLSKAIVHDRPWLFKALLKHPIDINQSVGLGQPPLHYAIQKGNHAAFQALLKRNATISKETAQLAAQCGQPEMVKALLDKMPKESILPEDKKLLEGLAKKQQREIQILAYSTKGELNTRLRNVLDKKLDIKPRLLQVRTLLLAGANPNALFFKSPDNGRSPLHIVAKYKTDQNGEQLIKLLLNMGADLRRKNNNGDTPLLTAARYKNLPVLKTLLQAGANPNVPDKIGVTPLHVAMNRHCEESVRALLEAKADPNAKDQYQRTPKQTHSWDFRHDPTLIHLLDQYGARPLAEENRLAMPRTDARREAAFVHTFGHMIGLPPG